MTRYAYRYPRPALTVDAVVFGVADTGLELLLIERGEDPFAGRWALPGGFVQEDEDVATACARELEQETGLRGAYLEQLATFSSPGRDPRGWTVSVAHMALVRSVDHAVTGASDARRATWVPEAKARDLAFDHDDIVAVARERLRSKVRWAPIGFSLLPERFTLSELQRVYEVVLGAPLDKRNFRRKILATGVLRALAEKRAGVAHRPSALYAFDARAYRRLSRQGFSLDL